MGRAVLKTPGLLFALMIAGLSGPARAVPVTETVDRVEVNWTTLKLRFYGQAEVAGDEDLRQAEKRAWSDGLNYVNRVVRDINLSAYGDMERNADVMAANASAAAQQVSSGTYSVTTVYFAEGKVRVVLESSLAKALANKQIRFRQKESIDNTQTEFSGVNIVCRSAIRPRPVIRVTDEAGAVLFGPQDLSEAAFGQGLMTRWVKRPSAAEISELAGRNPLSLSALRCSDQDIVVKKDEWLERLAGHQALLINGQVVVSLP